MSDFDTDQKVSDMIQHLPPTAISVLPSTNQTKRLNGSTPYHVPNTQITLHFEAYDRLILIQALKRVVKQVGLRAEEHIEREGDGWLSAADDPYNVQIPGCSFFAQSNLNPEPPMAPGMPAREQHLTYGMLVSVATGLWQWMVVREHVDALQFDIQDSHWGFVGMGSILPY